jgi:hypothetical protein
MAPSRRTPDLHLEQLRLGELPDAQAQALRAALAQDPTLQARLDALEQDAQRLLAAHPPHELAPALRRRLHVEQARADHAARQRKAQRGVLLLAPGLVAAGLAAWLMLPGGEPVATAPTLPGADTPDAVRLKGDPRLMLHRKQGARVEPLRAGALARPGDTLQVSYQAALKPHGVILSLDGRGAVTLHWPEQPHGSTALEPSGAHALPHAYELDDAPGFERFVFVTSDKPLDAEQVVEAARALAADPARAQRDPLPLSPSVSQTSFLVQKP